jgi:HK97 family phage major capsid protein
LDSVNFAVPTQILPFMKSYFAFSPFEKAGATIISTDHMRNVNVPVVAAGAPPSSYAEAQGPASGASGSQPFGLSGFTMGAHKRSRQVIASYESLQSTEVPMQPIIIDELLASIANVQTSDATTALNAALTGASSTLQITGSGVQADNYGQLTALRHALVEGLEDPNDCCWMLSRNSLAIIRNSRASTSGVVMFDPESDTILGRRYVVNEYFDSTCGAGFVAYGNWKRGAYLRRTPLLTRVLQELYWLNNEIGFLVTSWADNHFLAELVGVAQPPTFQPLYYTVLPSGSLS